MQYDRYGDEWWAITDAGGDLVALCDLLGEGYADVARVVAQWTYDAYGAVLTAEHLDGYTLDAAPHLGHKGLFLDRLDANVTQPRLVPFAHALYHARNRVYDVRHARWNQSDPNATALVLLDVAAHHGHAWGASVVDFDLDRLYGDGGNLYGYMLSNPWTNGDPMGLYVDFFLPDPAGFIGSVLESLVSDYAANLEWDVEWAMDWSLPDDDHSRIDNSWVGLAFGWGLYDAFTIGIPFTDLEFNPLDMWAGGGSKGKARRGGASSRRGFVLTGETIYTKRGREAHENYKLAVGPGYTFEQQVAGIGRPDAIDWNRRIVRELKPDTPSGLARGYKQLLRYKEALERETGQMWTTYLDTYRVDW